jgi:biotin carboxyl carrier protein
MKMESTLTAGCSGTVGSISIVVGDLVATGQLLITIEPEVAA